MEIRESAVLGKSPTDGIEFTLIIAAPFLVKDAEEGDYWACRFSLAPVVEILNPAMGVSALHSLVTALDGAYLLLKEASNKGDRVFRESAVEPGYYHPPEGMTLKEFFQRDI